MSALFFDRIYFLIVSLVHYKIQGMYLCRICALFALVFLLYMSRFVASFYVKLFAAAVTLVLYFLPELMRNFKVG